MGLAKNSQNFSCDVLVIGGGGAGLRSALEAREQGAQVIVVSKAKVGYGNNTIMSKAILTSPSWGDSGDNLRILSVEEDNANGLTNTVLRRQNDEMIMDSYPVQLQYVSPT